MKSGRALLTAAGASAAGLALIEAAAAWTTSRERRARNRPDATLYFEESGAGPPLIFLAGLTGSTRYWQSSFGQLARTRRLIFIDALGFGQSPWPKLSYTLDDHLNALRRTLVKAGATEAVSFVAHSFGAVLAAYYGARYSREIARLFLLGAPIFSDEAEARDRIVALSPMAALFSLNPLVAREACKLSCAFRPIMKRVAPAIRSDLRSEVAADAVLHFWESFNGTLHNVLLQRSMLDPLATIGPKTLFIHAMQDAVTPVARVREVAARCGAQLLLTTGGHQSYLMEDLPLVIEAISRLSL